MPIVVTNPEVRIFPADVVRRYCQHCRANTMQVGTTGRCCLQCIADHMGAGGGAGGKVACGCSLAPWDRYAAWPNTEAG